MRCAPANSGSGIAAPTVPSTLHLLSKCVEGCILPVEMPAEPPVRTHTRFRISSLRRRLYPLTDACQFDMLPRSPGSRAVGCNSIN
jgi:hypothetical protein